MGLEELSNGLPSLPRLSCQEASLLSQCELVIMDEADKLFGPELLPILEAWQAVHRSRWLRTS